MGNYSEIKLSTDSKYRSIKQIIGKRSIAIQWVIGDYDKVKEAFIRINEQGVSISADEKELIENDDLPTSQLSRAILSHGQGQKPLYQNEKTQELFDRFFTPFLSHQLKNYPLCGSLNEDFVISKVYNTIKIIDDSENLDIKSLELKSLEVLKFIQDNLNISHKVYFYGATKKFKTNSLYGFIRFSLHLMENKELSDLFIKNRKIFEEFLVTNERHIQDIARKKRQAKRAFEEVSSYYRMVLEACENNDFSELHSKYNYLDFDENKEKTQTPREKIIQNNYNQFIAETPRCVTCGGFIDGQENEQKTHKCCL